jgi:hypothetical protein
MRGFGYTIHSRYVLKLRMLTMRGGNAGVGESWAVLDGPDGLIIERRVPVMQIAAIKVNLRVASAMIQSSK